MEEIIETYSKDARHIILSYEDRVYYVSAVNVRFREGKETHTAIFHAKEASSGQLEELGLDIPQKLYELLVEYERIGDPDLIFVLLVEDREFRWGLVRESSLRMFIGREAVAGYVV